MVLPIPLAFLVSFVGAFVLISQGKAVEGSSFAAMGWKIELGITLLCFATGVLLRFVFLRSDAHRQGSG